jgi:tetratricopeptide (TPR) repeat protein
LDEAEAAYRKAAEISPQDPLPVYSLAVLAEDRGEIERALSYYEQSVKLDERFEYGHFSMAAMLANLGRFEEAIAELEVVLKLNPDALDARQMLEQIEEERRRADRK